MAMKLFHIKTKAILIGKWIALNECYIVIQSEMPVFFFITPAKNLGCIIKT